jgi:hypothetical protein
MKGKEVDDEGTLTNRNEYNKRNKGWRWSRGIKHCLARTKPCLLFSALQKRIRRRRRGENLDEEVMSS